MGNGDRAQETGTRIPGNQQRKQGGAPREGRPWGERQRERGVERREQEVLGGVRDGGGRDDRGGAEILGDTYCKQVPLSWIPDNQAQDSIRDPVYPYVHTFGTSVQMKTSQ